MKFETYFFIFWFPCLFFNHNVQALSSSVQFPVRSNVYFIVGTDSAFKAETIKVLTEIFEGIPLAKYRIAVSTTNGFFKGIADFKSKEWLLGDLREHIGTTETTLSQAFNEAKKDAIKYFLGDRNIFVALHSTTNLAHSFDYVIDIANADKKPWKKYEFFKENLNSCSTEGKVVYDECNRECSCVSGKMSNCYRVRSQFSTRSLADRLYYINAYKELRLNHRYHDEYVRLLLIHPAADFRILHGSKHILGFHRIYVLFMESLLRLIDCRITIPYWNFLIQGQNAFKPAPYYHIWDSYGGLGSTYTTPENGFCVTDGDFKYPDWTYPLKMQEMSASLNNSDTICSQMSMAPSLVQPKNGEAECKVFKKNFNPACVSRRINGMKVMPTLSWTYTMLMNKTVATFDEFMHEMIANVHAPLHDNLGGMFNTGCSCFNPEFFPFHSMIDAIWDFWQNKGTDYRNLQKSDNTTRIISFNLLRSHFIDNDNLGNRNMKIKYTSIF